MGSGRFVTAHGGSAAKFSATADKVIRRKTGLVQQAARRPHLVRQKKMFRQQFGVELSRKMMGCWVEQGAELLKPLSRSIREDLVAGNYLQADEIPFRYLDPGVKGKSQQGYLWTYNRPGGDVLFEWQVSRAREAFPSLPFIHARFPASFFDLGCGGRRF